MKRFVYIFLLFLPVWAQAFQVEMTAPVTDCYEGDILTLEIHIFPANPAQTSLTVDSVPRGFSLVSSKKERRSRETDSPFSFGRIDSVVIVQEWLAGRAGSHKLGPFIIEVNGIEQVLAPFECTVLVRETAGMGELRWSLEPGRDEIRKGAPLRLVLEARYVHEPVSLRVPLPKNALFEKQTGIPEDTAFSGQNWLPAASFIWTPLSTGRLELPRAQLEYRDREGYESTVATPPRFIDVLPAESRVDDNRISPVLAAAFEERNPAPEESDTVPVRYPLPESMSGSPDTNVLPALEAWNQGRYADALALLRRLEHVAVFPERYGKIRLDAEQELGISGSFAVPSRPRIQLLFLCSAVAGCIGLFLLPHRKRSRTVSRIAALCCAGFLVFGVAWFVMAVPSAKMAGVSYSGPLRQIPEEGAGSISTIPGGTPVQVLQKTGSWYYVRLPEALEGWVPHNQIIPYTTAGFYGFW